MLLNELQRLNNSLSVEKAKTVALTDNLKAQQALSLQQIREVVQLKQQVIEVKAQAQQLQTLAVRLQALEAKQSLQLVSNSHNSEEFSKP